MAKMSSINKNNKRIKLSEKFFKKRDKLKKIVMNKNHSYALLEKMNFPFIKKGDN